MDFSSNHRELKIEKKGTEIEFGIEQKGIDAQLWRRSHSVPELVEKNQHNGWNILIL